MTATTATALNLFLFDWPSAAAAIGTTERKEGRRSSSGLFPSFFIHILPLSFSPLLSPFLSFFVVRDKQREGKGEILRESSPHKYKLKGRVWPCVCVGPPPFAEQQQHQQKHLIIFPNPNNVRTLIVETE